MVVDTNVTELVGPFWGMGALSAFQRDLIYFPGTERVAPAKAGVADMTEVGITGADGLTLRGWYGAAAPGRPTVALFHGNAGTVAHRAFKARWLLDAGFGVLLVGYRGYGGNPGHPSETGLYTDARAALAWLAARGCAGADLVLYGESLGTGVAVEMACEHSAGAVVLEAPFTRLPELVPALVPAYGLADWLLPDHYDNQAKIGRLDLPLLILHGRQDGVVPVAMGESLRRAAGPLCEGLFFDRAGHNDLWDHGAGPAIIDFLDRRLGLATAER